MAYTIDIPQDFNVANQINFLKQVGHFETDMHVITDSIMHAFSALEISKREGVPPRVLNIYGDGFDEHRRCTNFAPYDILQHMSELPADTNKIIVKHTAGAEEKRRIEFIKQQVLLRTDEEAVRFALQFTYDVAKHMRQCKGTAFIGFIQSWHTPGKKMTTIFDKTISAKFGRAGRKIKNTVKKILPKKKPHQPRT